MASCRSASLRPESFLFRLTQKEEKRKGEFSLFRQSSSLLGPDPGAPPLQVMLLLTASWTLLLPPPSLKKRLNWWSSFER